MIADITQWILQLIREHGALAVFAGVILESIIVPIPSPLIIMGAGVILIPAGLGWTDAFVPIAGLIVLPGAVASTIGALFTFAIAAWGGKLLVDRFHVFLGFEYQDILDFERRLVHRPGLAIFLLRALPVVPLSLISAAAGVLRIQVPLFLLWTFLGSIPRCLILAYLGYFLHDSYEGMAGRLNRWESVASAAIVVVAFAVIFYLRHALKSKRTPTEAK